MFYWCYNRYSSTWYGAPVQIQKILYVMQIRSAKPCRLTAGGLYEMNIENFGVVCTNVFIILTAARYILY